MKPLKTERLAKVADVQSIQVTSRANARYGSQELLISLADSKKSAVASQEGPNGLVQSKSKQQHQHLPSLPELPPSAIYDNMTATGQTKS